MNDLSALKKRGELVFEFAAKQINHLVKTSPDFFPSFTKNGKWVHQVEGWTNWCEGFLGGLLWLLYQHKGDPWFREQAEHYTKLLEPRKHDCQVHDLGFLFMPTWKRWYDHSGDGSQNQVVLEAGNTLALRFQENGGYICSFEGRHSLYIDIMMNIDLLFYTAAQTNNENLMEIARRHCLTTRRHLVRGDGSTAHEGLFDPDSGAFIRQGTKQGWRSDSTWSRGQAWALNGFITAFSSTYDVRFLDTAEDIAGYILEHIPRNGIPPNDFDEPQPAVPYESSSAAITALGLWKLSGLPVDPSMASRYQDLSLTILESLMSSEFLAVETPGWEGILKHGIYHYPVGVGVDESVIWGDYYFLEAVSTVFADEKLEL